MSVVSRITSNKRGLIASLAAVAALGMTSAYTLGGFSASIADPTAPFPPPPSSCKKAMGRRPASPPAPAPAGQSRPNQRTCSVSMS